MKLLATAVFAGLLAVSSVAIAKEEPKKQISAEQVDKAPETKKVCVDVQGKDGKPVMDPKTKKPKQECRTVKVHKKYEGTKVPEGNKK